MKNLAFALAFVAALVATSCTEKVGQEEVPVTPEEPNVVAVEGEVIVDGITHRIDSANYYIKSDWNQCQISIFYAVADGELSGRLYLTMPPGRVGGRYDVKSMKQFFSAALYKGALRRSGLTGGDESQGTIVSQSVDGRLNIRTANDMVLSYGTTVALDVTGIAAVAARVDRDPGPVILPVSSVAFDERQYGDWLKLSYGGTPFINTNVSFIDKNAVHGSYPVRAGGNGIEFLDVNFYHDGKYISPGRFFPVGETVNRRLRANSV